MRALSRARVGLLVMGLWLASAAAWATPFTMTVPGSGLPLPDEYPEAGGVVIVLTGVNGNVYYQFSDPDGAFVGYQNNGRPRQFRGNPFTINDPIPLNCGFRTCEEYFGGAIRRMDVRFSAYDGDTQPGGFDENQIRLFINGFNVGSWSREITEITDDSGTQSFGFTQGFGNNTFNTGWFSVNFQVRPDALANILATGQTLPQVQDLTPNDNYWDFRRGQSLANEELRTIAPGYELEKTRDGGDTTFLSVGQQIDYTYIVRNIGSVRIEDVEVEDDKIGSVACTPTTLPRTFSGGTPSEAVCNGTYTVTQADVDAGSLTNIAIATGTPEFGALGEVEADVTLTGPPAAPELTIEKTASPTSFTGPGETITYTITARNDGNVTLTNINVTDPLLTGFSCSAATLPPASSENPAPANELTCTGSYTTTQADVDRAAAGTDLTNRATGTARDPGNRQVSGFDEATVTGPASAPALTIAKTADQTGFDAVGDLLTYDILITNTGNVTWPGPPTLTDPLTSDESCPAGPVAPNASIVCTASYAIVQDDLDAESRVNTATAEITVSGATASGFDSATVPATVITDFTVEKSQASGPNPVTAAGQQLTYSYLLRNDGNTAISFTGLSDDKITVTCPAQIIEAGATLSCTSDVYTVTQPDMDAGNVTNNVTATATTQAGSAVPDAIDQLIVPATPLPALTMDKEPARPIDSSEFAAGLMVDYTYTVTNTGNVTLPGPFEVIDTKFPDPIACPLGALAPGSGVVCAATYEVTSADVVNTFVTNEAYVTDGSTRSPSDSVTIPNDGTPGIGLEKLATDAAYSDPPATPPTYSAVGETVYFLFTVTNTGETPIDAAQVIAINDPALDSVTCNQPATLRPAPDTPSSFTCEGTYLVTQADIDRGSYTNTATASVVIGGETVSSPAVQETVQADITPGVSLDKTVTPATFDETTGTLTYDFTVTNLSVQRIDNVTVTDPLLPGLSCSFASIGPNGVETCQASYTVTQADLDRGSLANTATVNATASTGTPLSDTGSATANVVGADPALSVSKTASPTSFTAAGQAIGYTIAVENTGFRTLTDVQVSDPLLGLSCTLPAIAPGNTDSSCTGTRLTTQADVDAGAFRNEATASSATFGLSENGDVTVTGPTRDADYTFDKLVSGGFARVGDTVTYTFRVENTGNVTLTNLEVNDPFPLRAMPFTCTIASLAPGGVDTSCTFDYDVTQAEIDAGRIDNTATLDGTSVLGALPQSTDNATATGPAEDIDLRVDKSEADRVPSTSSDGFGAAGTDEGYLIEVTNESNVTLRGFRLVDALIGLDCTLPDLDPGDSTTTCADTTPLAGTYRVQQADVDNGSITNRATATGTSPRGTAVSETDVLTLLGPIQLPAIAMTKTARAGTFDSVGDRVTYDYVVENTGNITLTEEITIDDDRIAVTCPVNAAGIAPGASITCTGTEIVDQADLDAGVIVNRATAETSQPVVPSAAYPSGTADIESTEQTETVPLDQLPAITLDKRVASGSPATFEETSDVITFAFVVRNTGNVTTTAPILVNDPDIGITDLECAPAGLAPGASATCQAPWSPEQADLDLGTFTNTATASTRFDGTDFTDSDSVTVNAVQNVEFTLDKEFDATSIAAFQEGEIANYTYTVTNIGNVTLTQPLTITDNLIDSADISCPAGDIAPGSQLVCTGSYEITRADVELGSVTNVASASTPEGSSPPDSETIPDLADPAIEITKAASPTTFDTVGQVITYTYTVTNTTDRGADGSIPAALVNDIFIDDDRLDPNPDGSPQRPLCFDGSGGGQVAVGETITCAETGTYTITQADLDAVGIDPATGALRTTGFVTNNANGTTSTAAVPEVFSAPVSLTILAADRPELTVDKSSAAQPPLAPDARVDEGDVLTYTIVVTNTGNQTLSGVTVDDPLLAGLTCAVGGSPAPANLVLAPSESATCTGDYTVTQDDVDAGAIANTATGEASTPQGDPVSGSDNETRQLTDRTPSVSVAKTYDGTLDPLTGAGYAVPGQDLRYVITVTNDGNVTLSGVEVTDILFPGETCTIGRLERGETDTSCVFTYTTTQADIDRGEIFNEVTALATPIDPGLASVDDSDDLTLDGPTREPSILILKESATTSFQDDGATITYTYTISNNGNITITDTPVVSDDRIDTISCTDPPAGDFGPGDFYVCTGTDTVDQADLDAGFATNTATVTVADPLGGAPLTSTMALTIPADRDAMLSIVKSADDITDVVAGQTVRYFYDVTNTGNVTLTDVTVTDQQTSAAGTAPLSVTGSPVTSLDPGDSVRLSADYLVTQADIDAGADLTNIATASASPPTGATPPADVTDTLAVDLADPSGALTVIKTATAPATIAAGEVAQFRIEVTNTGNVTLDNLRLTDTLRDGDGNSITPAPVPVYVSGDTGTVDVLSIGETWVYTVDYRLTQSDIDSGGLSNSVTATGDDPSDTPVSDVSDNGTGDGDDPTPLALPESPALSSVKRITSTTIETGGLVRFEIDVTNDGNVTLDTLSLATDTLTRADGTPLSLDSGPTFQSASLLSPAGTLQPSETATYGATYRLTQADVDAGGIENVATFTARTPGGTPVTTTTVDDDPGDGNPADDPTELVIPANPSMLFDKSLDGIDDPDGFASSQSTFDEVGDTLNYVFTLTNDGNVTLRAPFTVDDPRITAAGGSTSCPATDIAPGASLACSGSYTVTQDDLDTGFFENEASGGNAQTTSPLDDARVEATRSPALQTVKRAVRITDGTDVFERGPGESIPASFFNEDAVIDYTFTVTNTGNVTITDPVTISDNRIATISCPALPASGLPPGADLVCTAQYTVTLADLDVFSVTNLASATDGTTTSPLVSEIVPTDADPALTLEKTLTDVLNPDTSSDPALVFDEVGDVLVYTFTVTNTGNAAFTRSIDIVDLLLDAPVNCKPAGPAFASGDVVTCEGRLTVEQADLDAGQVVNGAFAETIFPGAPDFPVTSAPVTETAVAGGVAEIALAKTAAPLPITGVGQVLTYSLRVENPGNRTLRDVVVTDPMLSGFSCTIPTLASGAREVCSGSYTVTQDDIDRGEVVNNAAVTALSPDGTPTNATASLTLDTPPAEPALTLAKMASPDPFGPVGSSITYSFTAGNTGNVTLFDVTVTDADADPGFSCVIPRLDVGADDDSCTLTVPVTQEDVDAGEIVNDAGATGRDPFGTIIDATASVATPSEPRTGALQATKVATVMDVTPGGSVSYTLFVQNTGELSLNVTGITDTMTRRDPAATPIALDAPFAFAGGDTDGDGLLDLDEIWRYTATRGVTQADIDAGGFDNTATVRGETPFGDPVSDVSDDGDDSDGNLTDDATEVVIAPGPELTAVKTVSVAGSLAGDEVLFVIDVTNTGTVTLRDVGIADTLTNLAGDALTPDSVVRVVPAGAGGAMAPGDDWQWEVRYTLTQVDVDAGGLANSATATGTPPSGPPVSDVSDNGNDTDGNVDDDATLMRIAPASDLDVVKTVETPSDPENPFFAGDTVSFRVVVANNGNVTLTDLVLTDTMAALDGTPLVADAIELVEGDDAEAIAPNSSNAYRVSFTLDQATIDAGGIENSVSVTGTQPGGATVTDVSDDGDDTDGNVLDDPTILAVDQINAMEATKEATVPVRIGTDTYRLTFTMTASNTGNVTQTNVRMTDDLADWAAPAQLVSTGTPRVSGLTTGGANTGFDGRGDLDLLAVPNTLAPGETVTVAIEVTYDTFDGFPEEENTVLVLSDGLTVPVTAAVMVERGANPDIFVSKSVTPEEALLGDTVLYTMTIENRLSVTEANLTFVDELPAGIVYTPGSATYGGADSPQPRLVGRTLLWEDLTLAPKEEVVITIAARVVGEAGELTNRAFMRGPGGDIVSNVAEATLRRRPEAVFDCGDVIGKVFDDRNFNGVQDGVVEPDRRLVTDQTFDGGKAEEAPVYTTPDHEPGLPGVRLSTVDGTLITTDQFGRFSVPCAALPERIGSNFTLKLDERTLPTGYRVTTENPRTLRLTPGTMARMNFGATIATLVDVDLMAAAFTGGGVSPSPALVAGIGQLVAQLRSAPSVLRLSYYTNGEGRALAEARLDAVEALIREAWAGQGGYRLLIERTIRAIQ